MKSRPPDIIMHINYCEQGRTVPEACCKAADWGYDGIELRGARAGIQESPEAYLDVVTAALDKSGLRHVLFGDPAADMMLPSAGARAQEVERCIRFYSAAKKRLGERFTLSNLFAGDLRNPDPAVPLNACEKHGSGCATQAQWDAAVEGYRLIGAAASELGLRLAFETHPHYLHDTAAAVKTLVDRIGVPSVGVNLDYANMLSFQTCGSLEEVVRFLGPAIYYVHWKNMLQLPSGGRVRVGLADGHINNREFLQLLDKSGYKGPVCLEAPRPGDREWFAQQDLAYARSLVADRETRG